IDLDRVHRVANAVQAVAPPPAEADLGRPGRAVGALAQYHGTDRGAMYKLEVVGIDGILGDHLGVHLHTLVPRPAIGYQRMESPRADVIAEHREGVGGRPQWLPAGAVMPDQDGVVEFGDLIGTHSPGFVGPILVGNVDVASG